jgi:RNA polymerase sigma factor (sigma-70 family)
MTICAASRTRAFNRSAQTLDGRAVRIIELRYFAGLSLDETAAVMKISSKTVQRIWVTARAWLRKELGREGGLSVSAAE